jgi:hypothetical protein
MKNFPLTHYFYGVCSSTIALLRMSTIYNMLLCNAKEDWPLAHYTTMYVPFISL